MDEEGYLANDFVTARKDGDVLLFNKEDVNLMDVGANPDGFCCCVIESHFLRMMMQTAP